ncbi:MAG: hypothetical protein H6718_09635 [Polyangiaceae bacterium]|nr:hypothetical protein [Polyangiaceae bacterium]
MSLHTQAKCTACGGELETGYIPDTGELVSPRASLMWAAVWVKGIAKARRGFFAAMRGGGIDVRGEQPLAIEAHRCTECGHLELFANHEATSDTTMVR